MLDGYRVPRLTGTVLQMLLLLFCAVQSVELRQVSHALTVVVTHHKKPIAGIKVEVVPEKGAETVFSGLTDESGTVLIQGLAVDATISRFRMKTSRPERNGLRLSLFPTPIQFGVLTLSERIGHIKRVEWRVPSRAWFREIRAIN